MVIEDIEVEIVAFGTVVGGRQVVIEVGNIVEVIAVEDAVLDSKFYKEYEI